MDVGDWHSLLNWSSKLLFPIGKVIVIRIIQTIFSLKGHAEIGADGIWPTGLSYALLLCDASYSPKQHLSTRHQGGLLYLSMPRPHQGFSSSCDGSSCFYVTSD